MIEEVVSEVEEGLEIAEVRSLPHNMRQKLMVVGQVEEVTSRAMDRLRRC